MDAINEIIKKYEVSGEFNYATVTDDMIATVETILNIKLPDQYVSFLKMFGHGGIGGLEVMGFGLNGSMIFVDATMNYRGEGMPENLVVIENVDEWLTSIVHGSSNKEIMMNIELKERFESLHNYVSDNPDAELKMVEETGAYVFATFDTAYETD